MDPAASGELVEEITMDIIIYKTYRLVPRQDSLQVKVREEEEEEGDLEWVLLGYFGVVVIVDGK